LIEMADLYYAPFQYELREQLGPQGKVVKALTLGRRIGVPAPFIAGTAAGVVFLAYTPLLQPGPAAKTYSPGELQFLSLGGGLIV
jgi:hypothetical protein